MNSTAELACRCKSVRGRVANAGPGTVNRIVCYCDDCQAFLHQLGRIDLLDEHGGTDIVQVAPASLTFDQGMEHIVGLRLSPKGIYRWYASCCNTPLGNSVEPKIPFVGITAQVFGESGNSGDAYFGPPLGKIFGKFAVGAPPAGSTKFNFGLMARALGKILSWKLRGQAWPHPFFDRATGAPTYKVSVLERDKREALRASCGPRAITI
jgi:hypothetical protein